MAMAKVLGEKRGAMAADMEQRSANISEKDPSSSAELWRRFAAIQHTDECHDQRHQDGW